MGRARSGRRGARSAQTSSDSKRPPESTGMKIISSRRDIGALRERVGEGAEPRVVAERGEQAQAPVVDAVDRLDSGGLLDAGG